MTFVAKVVERLTGGRRLRCVRMEFDPAADAFEVASQELIDVVNLRSVGPEAAGRLIFVRGMPPRRAFEATRAGAAAGPVYVSDI